MSDPLIYTLPRVEECLSDPRNIHLEMHRFNLTLVIQAVQVTVEDQGLAAELLKVAHVFNLLVESPLVSLMEEHGILAAFFTADTTPMDRWVYEQNVIPELQAGIDAIHNTHQYTPKYFQEKWDEVQPLMAKESVIQARDRGELKGCVSPSHNVINKMTSRVETLCSPNSCHGHFELPETPTQRYFNQYGHVRLKDDDHWQPRQAEPPQRKQVAKAKSRAAKIEQKLIESDEESMDEDEDSDTI